MTAQTPEVQIQFSTPTLAGKLPYINDANEGTVPL